MTDDSRATLVPEVLGTRVLLIGGGGSVGRTTARLARELGATPVVADRDQEALDRARNELGDVDAYVVDARSESSVAAVLDAAEADHVVLCTGYTFIRPLVEVELGELMHWVGDRLEPIFAIGKWIARNPGRTRSFTIVSGFLLRRPEPAIASWSMMGPAIIGLAENLAVQLAPTRVNVVGPGPMVDSTMLRHELGSDEAVSALIKTLQARNPARRAVRVEDTARQVLILAGDPVASGVFRPVDAGATLTAGTSLER